MAVIIGGPGVPELMVTASVCTPVRCLGCRIINIGCEVSTVEVERKHTLRSSGVQAQLHPSSRDATQAAPRSVGKRTVPVPVLYCTGGAGDSQRATAMALHAVQGAVGCRVCVHNLRSRPELNRLAGTVTSVDEAKGRLGVRLDGQGAPISVSCQR
jgi:hypothetical protein